MTTETVADIVADMKHGILGATTLCDRITAAHAREMAQKDAAIHGFNELAHKAIAEVRAAESRAETAEAELARLRGVGAATIEVLCGAQKFIAGRYSEQDGWVVAIGKAIDALTQTATQEPPQ